MIEYNYLVHTILYKQYLRLLGDVKMKVINLYVDDLRKCPNGFMVARNYKEAITYLNTCIKIYYL